MVVSSSCTVYNIPRPGTPDFRKALAIDRDFEVAIAVSQSFESSSVVI
jgi:hypothetical protein